MHLVFRSSKFALLLVFYSVAYWISAFLLMEAVEPTLDKYLLLDIAFTLLVFLSYFLILKRIWSRTFANKKAAR
jgi:hypothetical protein